MNFKKIEAIKNSIEFFEDAEFYSMAAKNAVIVKNIENEVLWEVPIVTVENVMLFDGKNAKIVGEDMMEETEEDVLAEEDHFYGKNGKLSDIAKEILTESIDFDMLREKIMSYQFKEQNSNNYQEILEEKNQEKTEEKKNKINEIFSENIKKYEDEKELFLKNGYMFNENDEIKKEFMIDPVYLTAIYEEKINNTQKFFSFVENEYSKAMKIVEKVNSAFENTEIPTNELFENIDFAKKDDIKTKILKNLLLIKKKHSLDFSINEMNKKAESLLSELYPVLEEFEKHEGEKFTNATAGFSQLATGDPRFPDRSLNFLKVNFNAFNRDDVMKLMEELNYAISRLYNEGDDPEKFKMLFVMRNALDYMIRKNMIDDSVVISVIKKFNDTYAKDNSDDFNDSEKGVVFSPSQYGKSDMISSFSDLSV